jgi:hypothetical protein
MKRKRENDFDFFEIYGLPYAKLPPFVLKNNTLAKKDEVEKPTMWFNHLKKVVNDEDVKKYKKITYECNKEEIRRIMKLNKMGKQKAKKQEFLIKKVENNKFNTQMFTSGAC